MQEFGLHMFKYSHKKQTHQPVSIDISPGHVMNMRANPRCSTCFGGEAYRHPQCYPIQFQSHYFLI